MHAQANDVELLQNSFEKCRVGVMPKWVMSDVYSMGCALKKDAHVVQMGIDMHSVIKQLCGGGATTDLLTKCTLVAAIVGIQSGTGVLQHLT